MRIWPVRRKERELTKEEATQLLEKGIFGVLATVDDTSQPYATPLSYIYLDGVLYFHSARDGHKISNLRFNPRCSFAVVGKNQPVYAKNFTMYYESTVAFGSATEVLDIEEKRAVLTALAQKYLPTHMDNAEKDISASLPRTAVYALTIDRITGKAKKEKQAGA